MQAYKNESTPAISYLDLILSCLLSLETTLFNSAKWHSMKYAGESPEYSLVIQGTIQTGVIFCQALQEL